MYQNQLQEDVLSEFGPTSRAKGQSIQKSSPFALDDVTDSAKDAKPKKLDGKEFMGQFANDEGDFECDLCDGGISLIDDMINRGIERGTALMTSVFEKELYQDFLHFLESFKITAGKHIYDLPKYEEELKVISSFCLFFWGGCWVRLASIIATAELFDTKKVIEEALDLGWRFMCVEQLYDNGDVTPFQLTMTLRNVGMHFALLLAVLHCGAWAEICVAFAFASKLSTILRLEEFLEDGTRMPDFYSAAEVEWIALISNIACVAISLIVLGMAPGFMIAIYMALIGIQCFFTGKYQLCLPTGSFTSKPYVFLTSEDYLDTNHQFSIWASVTCSAFWQAYYSYGGPCQFLSWLMFLLPVVKLFNLISCYFTFDMGTLKLD